VNVTTPILKLLSIDIILLQWHDDGEIIHSHAIWLHSEEQLEPNAQEMRQINLSQKLGQQALNTRKTCIKIHGSGLRHSLRSKVSTNTILRMAVFKTAGHRVAFFAYLSLKMWTDM
jgi:hypothetical protein